MQTIRGGGAKISWAQGRKVPKYGPAPTHPNLSLIPTHLSSLHFI